MLIYLVSYRISLNLLLIWNLWEPTLRYIKIDCWITIVSSLLLLHLWLHHHLWRSNLEIHTPNASLIHAHLRVYHIMTWSMRSIVHAKARTRNRMSLTIQLYGITHIASLVDRELWAGSRPSSHEILLLIVLIEVIWIASYSTSVALLLRLVALVEIIGVTDWWYEVVLGLCLVLVAKPVSMSLRNLHRYADRA